MLADDYLELEDRGEKHRISVGSQTPVQYEGEGYRVEHLEIGDVIRVIVREDDGRVANISLLENVRDKKNRPE